MKTLRQDLEALATEIANVVPHQSSCLRFLAVRVGRLEKALDEIVDDAREQAEIAERDARVRKFVPAIPARQGESV